MPSDQPGSPFDPNTNAEQSVPLAPPQWANIESMAKLAPMPGVTMWPLSGSNLTINFVRIEPGAEVPLHHHMHEQSGTVLEGTLILTIDGETRHLTRGDAYIAAPHSVHGATSGPEGCLVVDFFAPARDDYRIPPG